MRRLSFCALFGLQSLVMAQAQTVDVEPQAVMFANDGHLKMLYDNRMHPAAIVYDDQIFMTWRGKAGWPQVRAYDLETRTLSKQVNVFDGLEDVFDLEKYTTDQHYNPIIWIDRQGYFHLIAGCHGNWPERHNDCDKMRSKRPADIESGWEKTQTTIAESINYPKVYPIYGGQTLIHFRHSGHIGHWTYRISENGADDWYGADPPVVDMNHGASPFESCLDFFAGSYHNIRISPDGNTLHAAFVWQQDFEIKMLPDPFRGSDCEPPENKRYGFRGDAKIDTRYNLYYIKIDLPTGRVTNYLGETLTRPITRRIADERALIWNTQERLFAVPPAILIDDHEMPSFLGFVSEDTPYDGWFTFLRFKDGAWQRTRITESNHYFNAALLDKTATGDLRAFLIVGGREAASKSRSGDKLNLNNFGWGDRVEEWKSPDGGETWSLARDITPIEGYRYQNLKHVSGDVGQSVDDIVLFYGWAPDAQPGEAKAFLWDGRGSGPSKTPSEQPKETK